MGLVRKYSSRRGDVFFAYEIVGTSLVVKVFDVGSLYNFSITVDMKDKSPQSPKAFFMSTSYWGDFFERYGIAKRTGKSEIVGSFKNNVANEYSFDLSMMTPIKKINERIYFINVPKIFPKKDFNQCDTRNRWGLTESQTKEALQGVRHSDEVEEAIEWYKKNHNIE